MKKHFKETEFSRTLMEVATRSGKDFLFTAPEKTCDDTEYHQAFVVNANSKGFSFNDDDRPSRITKAFFTATAAFLSKTKVTKPDEAVALVLSDISGNFKFAAIVEYHENEENPEEPGNWSFVMTFNEKDLAELENEKTIKKYDCTCDQFTNVFDKIAYDVAGIMFQHQTYLYDACELVIDTLIQILDREGNSNDVVDIEFPGYITATVAVEDGEKIFAITPDGHLKTIIKDDTLVEKE